MHLKKEPSFSWTGESQGTRKESNVKISHSNLADLQKLNTELPYDPATPLLGTYLKELDTGTQTSPCARIFTCAMAKGGNC